MERLLPKDPNADRRCLNCKYYDVITNIQQQNQVPICRIEPPKMLAQMIATNQVDATGRTVQVPQWIPFSAWPIVGPNDWCGRFTRQLHTVPDTRSVEQRLTDAKVTPSGKG